MDREAIYRLCQRLGIKAVKSAETPHFVNAHCPLAPWTHKSGRDESPSFGVSKKEDKPSRFYCFACGHKGSLPKLVSMLARLRNDEELARYAQEIAKNERGAALQLPSFAKVYGASSAEAAPAIRRAERLDLPPAVSNSEAKRYLLKRGISPATANALGLLYDAPRSRIVFPVYDARLRLVGYTGRLIYEDPANKSNPKVRDYAGLPKQSVMLSAPHGIKNAKFYAHSRESFGGHRRAVIVVEGLFDYARLYELGFHRVAALLGSKLTDAKAEYLESLACPIIWMVDPDEAGDTFLYGPLIPGTDRRAYVTGAIARFRNTVPQFVVKYPDLGGKVDPGDTRLTFEHVKRMIVNSRLV